MLHRSHPTAARMPSAGRPAAGRGPTCCGGGQRCMVVHSQCSCSGLRPFFAGGFSYVRLDGVLGCGVYIRHGPVRFLGPSHARYCILIQTRIIRGACSGSGVSYRPELEVLSETIQHLASELPRILLPRTPVNKGKKRKGRGVAAPALPPASSAL